MSAYEDLPQISVSLLNAAALSKRSSLYVWMLENHDVFASVLKRAGRPNWEALARTFGDQGLRNAEGKPPSEETTRQTWWKVTKAMKARKDRRQAVAPPAVAWTETVQRPNPPPAKSTPPPSAPENSDPPPDDEGGYDFNQFVKDR
jgi:hypothetical protein